MRRLIWVLPVLAVLVVATAATAQNFGKHDLRSYTQGGEYCQPCHTPHHATQAGGDGLLWNRALALSADYTLFESSAVLGTRSLACLSCHDGVQAIEAFHGGKSTTTKLTGRLNLGRDLSDDHPVGIDYPTSSWYNPQSDTGLRYYGPARNRIECGTCHTVHEANNVYFLRKTNVNSALCLSCHKI